MTYQPDCWFRHAFKETVTSHIQQTGQLPQGGGGDAVFGVAAVTSGVPLTLVQRWLGHAKLETTAIYLDVIGPEERQFAARMWRA